jgi:hypothetical protein
MPPQFKKVEVARVEQKIPNKPKKRRTPTNRNYLSNKSKRLKRRLIYLIPVDQELLKPKSLKLLLEL